MSPIERFTLDTVTAIANLVKGNHYTQALIILYSAIDTLAWASISSGDVKRPDFCDWVSKYIDPEKTLGCSAIDLYAARCALLHSGAAKSKLSREGKANEIWYATSPKSIESLKTHAKQSSDPVKVVYFTDFLALFIDASESFSREIAKDKTKEIAINERIQNWIRFLPTTVIEKKHAPKI